MRVVYITLLILLCCQPANAAGGNALRAGNKAYYQQKYGEAFDLYNQAAQQGAGQIAAYNAAAALYKLKDYEAAQQTYGVLAQEDGKFKQNSLFNAGNAAYMQGDKKTASADFKQAILLNNKDEAAIHNLQFVLQDKDDNKQEQEQKEGDNKDRDNQNEQQNQNNQNQSNARQQEQKLSRSEADNILQMVKEQTQNPAPALPQNNDENETQADKDW